MVWSFKLLGRGLQLGHDGGCVSQFHASRVCLYALAEPLYGHGDDGRVVEGQRGQAVDGKPLGLAGIVAPAGLIALLGHYCGKGNGDDPLAGGASGLGKGVQLLQAEALQMVSSYNSRPAAASADASLSSRKPPGSAHAPLNGSPPRSISNRLRLAFSSPNTTVSVVTAGCQ